MQLSLFPDLPAPYHAPLRDTLIVQRAAGSVTALTRIQPERNQWRFYRLALWPDLFGQVCLVREWGRIGRPGRLRRDPFPDAVLAGQALEQLARTKRRRGYQDAA